MPINSDLSNNCGKKYIKNLLQATGSWNSGYEKRK